MKNVQQIINANLISRLDYKVVSSMYLQHMKQTCPTYTPITFNHLNLEQEFIR